MRMFQITPFVPCTELNRQISFYRDVLGFSVEFRADIYAFLRRDDVAVRLVQVDKTVDLKSPERQTSFYIDVEDLDALYLSMVQQLGALPSGRVRAPFNQDYGQREFHIKDEDCTLIFFGQKIAV